MKTAVIYRSKSGYVKKYADWIAEELGADIYDVRKISAQTLDEYGAVVYGGSLHAVGINGVGFIKDNFERLRGKKLVVFATGASPFSDRVLEEVADANFTKEQQALMKFFYLRGGFDYDKLPVSDKVLMTLLKLKIKLKKAGGSKLSPDEAGMFGAYSKPVDFTNKKYIEPVIEYLGS